MTNYVPLPDGPVIEGVLPTGHRWAGVELDGLVYYHVQGLDNLGVFCAPIGSSKYLITEPPKLLKSTSEVELLQMQMFALRLAKEKANAPTS